jgi:uncharacterized protein (TIGR03437 family)
MKTCTLLLTMCLSARLFGQGCVTFTGLKSSTLFDGSTITGLLRQPDGSYSAVTGTAFPPYDIENVVPNYDQWIGSCHAPPMGLSMPSVSVSPEQQLGKASQVVAFGYFVTGSMLPGAAFTATPSPQPHVSVGVIHNMIASVTAYPVPDGAATVATADFNKDGNLDLAVVYTGSFSNGGQSAGGVAILLGNGDGTFQSAVSYPAGPDAISETIADLNGDGKLDIVVTADSGSLTVLLGNGDGTFHSGSTITAGLSNPGSAVAQDFNGDGKLDLATANENGTVSVLLGKGDGTFGAPRNFPAGADCVYLAAGDFNKDGKLDLAVTNLDGGLISVLMGHGDGTFGAPAQYNSGYGPTGLILTDFNHDGNLDIVVGSGTPDIIAPDFGSGDVAVLLGNGDGTFQSAPLYPTGSGTHSIAAGDLNGDGKPDLVAANQYASTLSILLNAGSGTFQPASAYTLTSSSGGVAPSSVVLADFNGDGKLDAATADTGGAVSVSFGNGNGGFQQPAYYAAGTNPVFLAAGDLNGDGHPDLVTANSGNGSGDNGNVSVLLNKGTGALGAAANMSAGVQPVFLALKDLNGDGKLDLVVVNEGSFGVPGADPGGISVFLGKGDGTFQSPVSYAAGINPTAVAVGDLNGDGHPDLVVATNQMQFSGGVAVMRGNGDGTFQNPVYTSSQNAVSDIAIADLNGDGKLDVVLSSCCGLTYMSYLLGNGDGTLQAETLFNGGPSPESFALADLNNDNKLDVAIADDVGDVTVLLNTTATLTIKSATAGQVEPFAPESIVAAYGANLATGTAVATTLPLGTSLAGTTVTVTDSAGASRPALLFYVSPTQVNYEIPEGAAAGSATVTIKSGDGTTQTVTIQIGSVSPGIFQLNTSALVAAWVLPIIGGMQQNLQPVYQLNASQNIVPLPIDLGPSNEQIYLEMYGTGIRSAKNVTVTVGGQNVPVLFSGAAPLYAGEDQVNIGPLPRSLAGAGSVNIVLTADGQTANTVNVTIQ